MTLTNSMTIISQYRHVLSPVCCTESLLSIDLLTHVYMYAICHGSLKCRLKYYVFICVVADVDIDRDGVDDRAMTIAHF